MKKNITLLFAIVLFLSACASPAASVAEPTEQVEQPTTSPQPVENTAIATLTPEPTVTPTATPIPPDPIWFWSVDAVSLKVVAVNHFGERHELDALSSEDQLSTSVHLIAPDQALLVVTTDGLQIYLLTPQTMQAIDLGDSLSGIRLDEITKSLDVVASNPGHAVFSLITEDGYGSMPDNGPIFWVDLASLTVTRLDNEVSRSILDSRRNWFHTSPDGNFLRYISGKTSNMSIRELDMSTGETRTIVSAKGSPYAVYASLHGDLWYLENTGLIVDTAGNQTTFNEPGFSLRLVGEGDGLVIPDDCTDDCTVRVISPFMDLPELSYQVPWEVQPRYAWAEVSQLLPDQSLLLTGAPGFVLTSEPALSLDYPLFATENAPLFRLTPDGQYSPVGWYNKIEASLFYASPDGRYAVLQALDKTNFFIYDTHTGKTFMTIPMDPSRPTPYAYNTFYENGMLVNLSILNADTGSQQVIYASYNYETGNGAVWEDNAFEIVSCPALFDDGTLVCWFSSKANPGNFDLVRFDPVSGSRTLLLENTWFVDYLH